MWPSNYRWEYDPEEKCYRLYRRKSYMDTWDHCPLPDEYLESRMNELQASVDTVNEERKLFGYNSLRLVETNEC